MKKTRTENHSTSYEITYLEEGLILAEFQSLDFKGLMAMMSEDKEGKTNKTRKKVPRPETLQKREDGRLVIIEDKAASIRITVFKDGVVLYEQGEERTGMALSSCKGLPSDYAIKSKADADIMMNLPWYIPIQIHGGCRADHNNESRNDSEVEFRFESDSFDWDGMPCTPDFVEEIFSRAEEEDRKREYSERLERAWSRLTNAQQEALYLYIVKGMSMRDVGKHIGKSFDSAKDRIYGGLKKLKKYF